MINGMYLTRVAISAFGMIASSMVAIGQDISGSPFAPNAGSAAFMRTPRLYDETLLHPPDAALGIPAASIAAVKPLRSILRAGLVLEDVNEPGKIKGGEVIWSLQPGVRTANAEVRLGPGQGTFSFAVTSRSAGGQIIINVWSRPGGVIPQLADVAVPRVRRPSALEGEPLIGRVRESGEGSYVIELSTDPIDRKNNLSRILSREWLDFLLRDTSGVETILTVEIGKSGREMLQAVLAPSTHPN